MNIISQKENPHDFAPKLQHSEFTLVFISFRNFTRNKLTSLSRKHFRHLDLAEL